MTDISNAEHTGPLSNGPADSAGGAHSGVDGQGAVTGPESAEPTQSGVHGDTAAFDPALLTPDSLSTASPDLFAERMDPAFPGLRSALEIRWGGEYSERLASVHSLGTSMLEAMGPHRYHDFVGKLIATGALRDPGTWDALSRITPAEAAAMVAPQQTEGRQSMPGTTEDMKGRLDELRSRQRDIARSGPIGSVRAQAMQPEIDALDRQVNGTGPIVGNAGRNY